MGSKLFVSNLSAHTTEAELLDLFGEVGTVVSVVISVDHRTGVRNNHAFVDMETTELAQAAVQKLDGYALHSRKLNVKELRATEKMSLGEGLRYEKRGWSAGPRQAPK